MIISEKNNLFLVVLGGRAIKANVELHDVRWVVGSKIEDTYDVLRKDWFGSIKGLHIDSYKKIKYVDGYKINLKKYEKKKRPLNKINSKKKLWFVNIGGYESISMQEKHEFGLVVATSKLEAKSRAKSKWLFDYEKKHIDDISSLKMLNSCHDCQIIKKIGDWKIELTLESNIVEETNYPDWYGYKRIDIVKKSLNPINGKQIC